jgi:UDP-glucose 4-epimerase
MTWLVTGGAGYIGSHVVRDFQAAGVSVVVLDDLSSGLVGRVPSGVPLIKLDIRDTERFEQALRDNSVQGVVHLAAKKAVGESVEQPLMYYEQNVGGVISLLTAMSGAGIEKLVYSSSAAVYGSPGVPQVNEVSETRPESPYGETKLIGEWLIKAQSHATNLKAVSLRYFNVVGAGDKTLGDTSVNNLVPLIFSALENEISPQVFGDDYPTPDGTCIRDYIDVRDLSAAHVRAMQWLETAGVDYQVFNVGRGEGVSVKDMMQVARQATGIDFEYRVVGRRAGDPAQLVGQVGNANRDLKWEARFGVEEMVTSAWRAWRAAHD